MRPHMSAPVESVRVFSIMAKVSHVYVHKVHCYQGDGCMTISFIPMQALDGHQEPGYEAS